MSNSNYKLPENASITWEITSGLVINGLDKVFTYNGSEQEPEMEVYFNDRKLTEGVDYTLEFTDNKNVGTAKVSVVPTSTSEFKQKNINFTINPATITVTGGSATKVYDGTTDLTAATQVTVNTTGIVDGDEITVTVKEGAFAKKDAGETLLDVNEYQLAGDEKTIKNYTLADDKPALEAIITQKEVSLVWSTPTSFAYDNEEKEVTASVDPTSVVEGDEVAVTEYTGNKSAEIGEHTATATALGNSNYKLPENASITWEITSGLVVSGLDKAFTYNGSELEPEMEVYFNDSKLTEGIDYTLVFSDNKNAGTAKVSVVPTESALFTQRDSTFTINPATITVTGGSATKVYDGTTDLTAATQVTVNSTGIVVGDEITVTVKEGAFAKKDAGETLLDVNEYQLAGDENALKNYTLADDKPALEAVITQKEISLVWSTPTSFAYDNEEKEVTATVDPTSVVEGDEVAVSEYTGNKSAEIGEHTATATALGNSNYKLPEDASITWEITSGLVVSGLDKVFTYNGNEQEPEMEVYFNDSKLTEGVDYTLVFSDNKNAGTANVSVVPTESALFSKKDFTFTINPATIIVTGGSATKVYDGTTNLTEATQVTVNSTGIVDGDEIAVTVKEGAFAKKDAGETLLDVNEYQLAGDEKTIKNYTLADDKPALEAIITQKEVNLVWSTPTTFAYDNEEKEVTATVDPTSVVEGDEVAVSEYDGNNAKGIGKYIAYATSLNNDNYKIADKTRNIIWQITSGLTVTGLDEVLTYNGNEQEPEIKVSFNEQKLEKDVDYTLAFTNNKNAGQAKVTILPIKNEETSTTLFEQKEFEFTIAPAVITVTGGTATKVYNGNVNITTETSTDISFTGKIGDEDISVTVKSGSFAQKEAGETELNVTEYQLAGNEAKSGNYTLANEKPSLTAVIEQKEVALTWSTPTTFAYDGEVKEVTANIVASYIVEGDVVSVSAYTGNQSSEKGEHTATATALSNSNYKLPKNASKFWEITDGLEITGPTEALTYNGKEQQPEVTVKYNGVILVEKSDYTLKYSDNKNAGTAKVSVIPTSTSDFKQKDIEFTIHPAVITITGGTATKVYDGNNEFTDGTITHFIVTGKIASDNISVIVKNGVFAQKDAGETELEITELLLNGSAGTVNNYVLASSTPKFKAEIKQKEVNLTWSTPTSFVYDGEEKVITANIEPSSIVEGDEVTISEYSGNQSADKGEYTATAVALDNSNYKLPENASIAWEIVGGLEILPIEELTYNGKEQQPEVTVLFNDKKIVENTDYTLEFTDNINAGTAKVSVTSTGTLAFTPKEATFTIQPAVITVTGGNATKQYDGSYDFTTETAVDLVYEGMVGTDDISVNVKSGLFEQKDAGETVLNVTKYQLAGEAAATGNYILAENSPALSATIEQKEVALIWSTPTTFAYDGLEKEVTATIKASSVVEGDIVSVSAYTGNKSAEKGEHTATATALSNNNYKLPENASKDWEITDGLEITGPTDALTYNGEEQRPEVTVKYNGVVLIENTDYTLVYSNNKNAGTGKVSVVPTSTSEFKQKDIEFTIIPAVITVTGGTATKVYDGTDEFTAETVADPVFTGKVGNDELTVSVRNGVFAQKEAGETELSATEMALVGDESVVSNYYLTVNKPKFDAIIEQKEVTLVWSTPTTFEYDGEEKEVTATVDISSIAEGDVVAVSEYSDNRSAEIREHFATADLLDNNNYKLPENAGISWEIISAVVPAEDYSIAIAVPTSGYVYDRLPKEPTVEVRIGDKLIDSSEYELSYTSNTRAGEAKVTVSAKYGANYTFETKEATFEIAKAVINVATEITGKEYDGTVKAEVSSITTGIIDGDDVVVNADAAYNDPNAGTDKPVKILYTIEGTDKANYQLSATSLDTIAAIAPKKLTLVWSEKKFTFDGTEKSVSVVAYKGVVGNEEVKVEEYSNQAKTNAGNYTAKVEKLSSQNYTIGVGEETEWTISARKTDITIVATENNFTYNGKEQMSPIIVKDGDTEIPAENYSVRYENTINAGKATFTVEAKEDGNYIFKAKGGRYEIKPAAITFESESKTWVYDGNEHKAPKVTLTEGELFGDDSFDFAVTGAITAVGKVDNEFTVTPKDGTLASNYTITEKVGVLTVKANKISPITTDPITGEKTIVDPVTGETVPLTDPTMGYEVVVNPGNSEIVYDGKKKEPVVELFINGVKVPADEYNIVYKANTNAGTAHVSVTDNNGGDYTFIGTTADFKIEPRELTLEWGETEFTYNGKRQQVSHTLQGVLDGDKVKVQVKGDTATNANSYKAIASGVDNKNYILRPDTVKWTILKADTEMPTLTPIAETEAGTKDGQIEGLQKGMEMKKEGEKKFAPVKDPAVKLAPGNYIVRIAGDKNHNASEEVLVTIQAGTVPYAIDSIIVPAFGYCPATDDNIRYVVSGENHPAAFRIIYSKEAEAAGFKNTGYIDITENGTLPVTIPNCDANTYKAKLQFRSVNNIESKTFDIELMVNLSADYMTDIFEDVISAVNTEERFLEYQWYHNDILLEGETKPYYNQNKTLNGSYYMEVLTVDDRKLKTCRLNFEAVEADKLTAYPNPTHDYTTIELTNDNEEEHTLEVFSSAGERVKSDTFTGAKTEVNFVDLPQGVYIVKVDGLEVKVLKY
ncbi:MAG: T9SS type A sorting domain-containing protein [Paludibacteraceae bacterium]|nr:T9SS type A sorting domain-containing protein [Paludibacteraceae bacterium]